MSRQLALAVLLFAMEACSPPGVATASGATIHSFIATPAIIAPGQTATLAATFSNGTGRINQGIGPIASGASVIVAPSADTTYTLMVTDAMGSPVSRTAAVSVAIPGTQVVTITASPPSLTNQTTASFSFNSSLASSIFNCKLGRRGRLFEPVELLGPHRRQPHLHADGDRHGGQCIDSGLL